MRIRKTTTTISACLFVGKGTSRLLRSRSWWKLPLISQKRTCRTLPVSSPVQIPGKFILYFMWISFSPGIENAFGKSHLPNGPAPPHFLFWQLTPEGGDGARSAWRPGGRVLKTVSQHLDRWYSILSRMQNKTVWIMGNIRILILLIMNFEENRKNVHWSVSIIIFCGVSLDEIIPIS